MCLHPGSGRAQLHQYEEGVLARSLSGAEHPQIVPDELSWLQEAGHREASRCLEQPGGERRRRPFAAPLSVLCPDFRGWLHSRLLSFQLRAKAQGSLPGATFARRRESRGGSEPSQDANAFGVNTSTCRRDLVCVVV